MKTPRISLKQLLVVTALAGIFSWGVASYESWYGVRWTTADATLLKSEIAALDGEISEAQAVRVAIDEAVSRGCTLRILPNGVARGVCTLFSGGGNQIKTVNVECYIVFLDWVPKGIDGPLFRIRGGNCAVYVGLDGAVLRYMGGA